MKIGCPQKIKLISDSIINTIPAADPIRCGEGMESGCPGGEEERVA